MTERSEVTGRLSTERSEVTGWLSAVRVIAEGGPELAINRLRRRIGIDAAAVDKFLAGHEVPLVEGRFCTFLYRGEADEVRLAQRIVGLPDRLPMRRLPGTDLWYVILEVPEGSRIEYQLEVCREGRVESHNDPLNPKLSYSPVGSSSVCFGPGYVTPDWTVPDPAAPAGQLTDLVLQSRALGRDCAVTLYMPAGFRPTGIYPLLVVHDGGDFLTYAAAQTVLDNLIHRRQVAETVVAFLHPKDRLTEYADSAEHAEFVTHELLPLLETELPLAAEPSARCLLGSSFGAIAALSTARRFPGTYGSLVLLSGSFVFTVDGAPHGGGPAFDPVVEFVNDYRKRPTKVADRLFVSCGAFEPLIVRQRPMLETFRSVGMRVRYVEPYDGHNWVNWRDRLCAALSWVNPPG
ncbi:MAG TPA: alpha/beta hydrolase-fold protein [Actinoplanes sp.]|nr:alpha/beta hydrolase-fold protein [Actinoplanes sp.]